MRVGDHDDGGALIVQLAQEVHYLAAVLRIKVSRRLVGEDDFRTGDDGAGNGDTLLLTAGELAGEMLGAMADIHAAHGFLDALAALGAGHPHIKQWQFDVLFDTEVVNQVKRLEDETDEAFAQSVALRLAEVAHVLSAEQILSVGGGVEQSEDIEQCGLATAAGAHDGDELAFVDVDVHAAEGDSAHFFRLERALEVHCLDHIS